MGKTTCIRKADWVIAWDEGNRCHVYLCEADVVFEDDTIVFVGRGYAGPVDTTVNGSNLCVMPGLVDIHSHPIGFLGPNCTLAHVLFIDEHSRLHWWTREDIHLLAATGTTVAHCPTPFARYGQTLEHFGKYRKAGVNLGIGTDVAPHNILEEMHCLFLY